MRGYGIFRIGRKIYLAHRIAWVIENGPIPEGMLVCHKCDNRECVEADHFFLGTNKENMEDAAKKGRVASGDSHYSITHPEKMVRGEKHGNRKLTDISILEIRKRYSNGEKQEKLAKDFGIYQPQVSKIVKRKSWAHI